MKNAMMALILIEIAAGVVLGFTGWTYIQPYVSRVALPSA